MIDDEKSLDELRQRMQESLIQAKRDQLRQEFGMVDGFRDPALPPEIEVEWLEYIYRFEKHFEDARIVPVRERLGWPKLDPLEEISADKLPSAVDELLQLLMDFNISVDFFGDWPLAEMYRYLTEELMEEEIEEIPFEDVFACFTPSTPEYDMEMWIEFFVRDVFKHDLSGALNGLSCQVLLDAQGRPVAPSIVKNQLADVWEYMPPIQNPTIEFSRTKVVGERGEAAARISWELGDETLTVNSDFRMGMCPHEGWEVVQTTLLADLLTMLRIDNSTPD
ncbi:MAG: hypothetical protein QNJ45_29180 [Ardenticatenaceae bacterium]|nr:hypothetical protein [Ardenticatenaceae bacterium]